MNVGVLCTAPVTLQMPRNAADQVKPPRYTTSAVYVCRTMGGSNMPVMSACMHPVDYAWQQVAYVALILTVAVCMGYAVPYDPPSNLSGSQQDKVAAPFKKDGLELYACAHRITDIQFII